MSPPIDVEEESAAGGATTQPASGGTFRFWHGLLIGLVGGLVIGVGGGMILGRRRREVQTAVPLPIPGEVGIEQVDTKRAGPGPQEVPTPPKTKPPPGEPPITTHPEPRTQATPRPPAGLAPVVRDVTPTPDSFAPNLIRGRVPYPIEPVGPGRATAEAVTYFGGTGYARLPGGLVVRVEVPDGSGEVLPGQLIDVEWGQE